MKFRDLCACRNGSGGVAEFVQKRIQKDCRKKPHSQQTE